MTFPNYDKEMPELPSCVVGANNTLFTMNTPRPTNYDEMMTKTSGGYPVVRRPSSLSPTLPSSLVSAKSSSSRKASLCAAVGGMPMPVDNKLFGLRRPPATTTTTASTTTTRDGGGETSNKVASLARVVSASNDGGNCDDNDNDNDNTQHRTTKNKKNVVVFPRAYSVSSSSSSNSSFGDDPSRAPARANATFSLVQRSGAPAIRDVIASVDRTTKQKQQARRVGEAPRPPTAELDALADCSHDPYYRVIVAASGGIPSIVSAMKAFRYDEDVQAAGCKALKSLCAKSVSNQAAVSRVEGAMEVLLDAVGTFGGSGSNGNTVLRGDGMDVLRMHDQRKHRDE